MLQLLPISAEKTLSIEKYPLLDVYNTGDCKLRQNTG